MRPDRLFAVSGPQARVQRRTVQQIVDFAPLPTLDDPAPQIWYSCLTCSAFFGRSHLIPSRLSKCPRSCLRTSPCERQFASRSWWNSWWKCLRSFPGPCCSGLWSRTWAFQLLIVVGGVLVFKVFFPDRVQHRCLVLKNAFQSEMWSRSLVLVCLVAAIKIFSQDKVHPLLLTIQLVFMKLWMGLVKGFFALVPLFFSKKKSAGVAPHSGSELAADSSPSTRRAYCVPMAVEEDESEPVTESELEDEGEINAWVDDNGDSWVLFQSVHGPFWRNITKKRSQWHPPWRRLR